LLLTPFTKLSDTGYWYSDEWKTDNEMEKIWIETVELIKVLSGRSLARLGPITLQFFVTTVRPLLIAD
jgi:hypothetical protein